MAYLTLFKTPVDTENKVRWDCFVGDVKFSLYIPKKRVPDPWPERIRVGINRVPQGHYTSSDRGAASGNLHESIVAIVEKFREHTRTIRYRPIGDPDHWEIGEPYIPFDLTRDCADRLRITVDWVTSGADG